MIDDGMLYTAVGHRGMAVCNPLGTDQFGEMLGLLDPASAALALDIGCGKAELLIRLAERAGCSGVGLDVNEMLLTEGREAAERRVPGLVQLHCVDARSFPVAADGYDIVTALGASQALGGTAGTVKVLGFAVRPGGRIALGEGFWRRAPTEDELAVLDGVTRESMMTLDELVATCDAAQLETAAVIVTRDEDFDRYEWRHHRNLSAYVRSRPDDGQARRLWSRRMQWRDAYLRAGRGLFGFAVVVAQRR